jgi:hypothetical protein
LPGLKQNSLRIPELGRTEKEEQFLGREDQVQLTFLVAGSRQVMGFLALTSQSGLGIGQSGIVRSAGF